MKIVVFRIIKVISFLLIFTLLFSACQYILHYRWSKDEDIYTRNLDFENQPKDSLDVLYFGTSEIYAGIDPIITYAHEGITGYNFAVSYKSAVTTYYQLLYALKHQTPKVVACDFEALFDDSLPNDNEPLYRKIYETMPDQDIKNQLLNEIMQLDSNQDYLSWKYPLLRYHDLWSELNKSNFTPDYKYDKEYKLYKKGSLMSSEEFIGDIYKITPDLWQAEKSDIKLSDISVKYYDMFIEECKRNEIKVLAIIPPKVSSGKKLSSRWDTIKDYFDSREIDYLNYNSYEQITRMGLNLADHYLNAAHLNALGSIVFSKALAEDLQNKYGFNGRKDDISISTDWDSAYASFLEEIPSYQPDLDKCLSVISELDMDSLVYIHDKNSVNYEKYSSALSAKGINCDELQSTQYAAIINNNSKVIQKQELKESFSNFELYDSGNQVTITLGNESIDIITPEKYDKTDLSVITFNDEELVSYINFYKH